MALYLHFLMLLVGRTSYTIVNYECSYWNKAVGQVILCCQVWDKEKENFVQ